MWVGGKDDYLRSHTGKPSHGNNCITLSEHWQQGFGPHPGLPAPQYSLYLPHCSTSCSESANIDKSWKSLPGSHSSWVVMKVLCE